MFLLSGIRFGAAAIAASVGGATRSGRLGGAAAAGRRSPSGRRWSSGDAAPASYGVIANMRWSSGVRRSFFDWRKATVFVGLRRLIVPPELPVYEQRAIPDPGYLWSPGYWAYGPDGYFWL